jgi:hypothetical protein
VGSAPQLSPRAKEGHHQVRDIAQGLPDKRRGTGFASKPKFSSGEGSF